ncbi:MAG: hypothetical protein Q7R72_02845 [bacterium]|nr:hypothetical protein [bacterium]
MKTILFVLWQGSILVVMLLLASYLAFTFSEFFDLSPPVAKFVMGFSYFTVGIVWYMRVPKISNNKKEVRWRVT